jgi:hypothetical protein
MTAEIPPAVQQFARELAALARKHGMRHVQGWFQPGFDHGWSPRVEFDWMDGRHGEDSDKVRLSSTHQITVRASLGERHGD